MKESVKEELTLLRLILTLSTAIIISLIAWVVNDNNSDSPYLTVALIGVTISVIVIVCSIARMILKIKYLAKNGI